MLLIIIVTSDNYNEKDNNMSQNRTNSKYIVHIICRTTTKYDAPRHIASQTSAKKAPETGQFGLWSTAVAKAKKHPQDHYMRP